MANMIANFKLWTAAAGVATSVPIIYVASKPKLWGLFELLRSGSILNVLAALFALLNLKSLPLAWHIRVFRSLLTHINLRGSQAHLTASNIFTPVITTSYTSPLECDYNLHKSNSTYFSDLDVSRSHLLSCLLARGIQKARLRSRRLAPDDGNSTEGKLGVMLGGVTCSFKKEIKPFERFEIWTRVLAWDRKWLYLVSHIVKKGQVRPRNYILNSWRKGVDKEHMNSAREMPVGATPHPAIFATSIAKYVFKNGRVTIPPEEVLQASELLPEKPVNKQSVLKSEFDTKGSSSAKVEAESVIGKASNSDMEELKKASSNPESGEVWNWNRVEQERAKGMEIAIHMARLDDLHGTFTGETRPAFGQY